MNLDCSQILDPGGNGSNQFPITGQNLARSAEPSRPSTFFVRIAQRSAQFGVPSMFDSLEVQVLFTT